MPKDARQRSTDQSPSPAPNAPTAPSQPPSKPKKRIPGAGRKTAGQLSKQQDRFCHAYVETLNATKAAIAAGYSKRTPANAGMQQLRHPHVLARIEALQAARLARMDVDADFVLRRLVDEIDANVRDLYDPESGVMKHPSEWPEVWQRGLVTHIQTTELYGPPDPKTGRPSVIGHLKDVTFADRIKRIELLGRHINVQAFKERVAVGVDAPLRALFDQIAGQSIRPASEMRTIEHVPSDGEGT